MTLSRRPAPSSDSRRDFPDFPDPPDPPVPPVPPSAAPPARHHLTLLDKLPTTAHGNMTGHPSMTASHHPPTAALSHLVPPESRYHSGIHRPARPCPLIHSTQIAPNANHPRIEMGTSTLTISSGQ
ncbi:hypothetical protein E4U53_000947 [Claviceps sorghi]|nr:hypothetical protein E4U53_000947 [Claviceps sorghi]